MKTATLLLIFPLLAAAQSTQPNLQWVDREVAAIKPPRKGVSPAKLVGIRDPFLAQLQLNQPPVTKKEGDTPLKKPVKPEEQKHMVLQAVFNKHTAMIDGKWCKTEDKVYGYVLREIGRDSVLLTKKKKRLRLSLKTKNDKIKINAK